MRYFLALFFFTSFCFGEEITYSFDYMVVFDCESAEGASNSENYSGKIYYLINSNDDSYYGHVVESSKGEYMIRLRDFDNKIYATAFLDENSFLAAETFVITKKINYSSFVGHKFLKKSFNVEIQVYGNTSKIYSLTYKKKRKEKKYNTLSFHYLTDSQYTDQYQGVGFDMFRKVFTNEDRLVDWIIESYKTQLDGNSVNHRKLDTILPARRSIIVKDDYFIKVN